MAAQASKKIDILLVHQKILDGFEKDRKNLNQKIELKNTIHEMLQKKNNIAHSSFIHLTQQYENLEKEICDIRDSCSESFYLMEAADIISEYQQILNRPQKVSFMGTPVEIDDGKDDLIQKYITVARKHCPSINVIVEEKKETVDCCEKCGSTELSESDGFLICIECGKESKIAASSSSYKDAERVNVGSKYTYDKRIHFRDCINQFQGKQNSTIPEKVYELLAQDFDAHGLLVKSPIREVKFSQITKEHILLFLKERGFSKHYEDAVLIHYNFTGIKPPDISHLETAIVNDFDQLVDSYEEIFNKSSDYDKKVNRKNFINNQYVLYQLLRKHGYPCDISEFSILKTTERKHFHDDVCRELFRALGWKFCSVF